MPVGLAWDLPYPMILGWDWPEIYKVLGVAKNIRRGEVSLAGEDTGDLDLEQLTSSQPFQKAQEEEQEFWAVWEMELAKVEDEGSECHFQVRRFPDATDQRASRRCYEKEDRMTLGTADVEPIIQKPQGWFSPADRRTRAEDR
ncbi:hypothetical protein Y1Q_0009950 [Alligator mississippiensis]|uniref:Uncharacterized protein n=1 Tax=Alligator mississippiensis TaxID=8496 RepID=A0A151MXE0_ALLMI|nr:hypothetical protein Y1Q_0009950 [Alligator mississippiensis]